MNDGHWDEFVRRTDAWRQAGDTARLKLIDLYHEAHRYRETDPEFQYGLLTRARDEARRLEEPWWVLFFEHSLLSTLTADMHDFARAHPLAMEVMLRFNSPAGRTHPHRMGILTNVLYVYLQIDPAGYRDELEQGFSYLDEQIARGPVTDRFVLNYRWTEYLVETQQLDAAYQRAQRFLELVDSGVPVDSIWWQCWVLFLLCPICDALGLVDELTGHAEDLAERSKKGDQLTRTRAGGCLWFAVARRAAGDEQAASRSFHQGMSCLKNLSSRDEICADAVARYYELGNDYQAAIGIRNKELAMVTKKGMLHRCCRVQIERCRLLSRAGALTPAEVNEARQAATKMRVPDWYLQKLVEIEGS
jgi:hypothetical protein